MPVSGPYVGFIVEVYGFVNKSSLILVLESNKKSLGFFVLRTRFSFIVIMSWLDLEFFSLSENTVRFLQSAALELEPFYDYVQLFLRSLDE